MTTYPMQHKVNTSFKYTTAAETSKPGYLKARFEEIRKKQTTPISAVLHQLRGNK